MRSEGDEYVESYIPFFLDYFQSSMNVQLVTNMAIVDYLLKYLS
jgi:hypothetical protein